MCVCVCYAVCKICVVAAVQFIWSISYISVSIAPFIYCCFLCISLSFVLFMVNSGEATLRKAVVYF